MSAERAEHDYFHPPGGTPNRKGHTCKCMCADCWQERPGEPTSLCLCPECACRKAKP